LRGEGGERSLDTFTAIFPELPAADLRRIDERAFVDAVLAQGGFEAHHVRGDLLSPLTDVDRALWHLDEAFAAPNLYLHWGLYGAARAQGVRTLLDGIDGDTTVSHGFEYLPALARSGRALTLGRELRALSQRHRAGVGQLFWDLALQPLVPPALRHSVRRLRRGEQGRLAGTVIRPEFARRMGIEDRLETLERRERPGGGPTRQVHADAMQSGLIPYALEVADKAAAAFGVEPRYPFFDRRLMELCLAMPPDQKLHGGWTRLVMRRAMAGRLPEPVRWRSSKANLAPNFKRRLLEKDGSLLAEMVLDQAGVIDEYVDVPALRRAYDRYVAEPGSEADALTVFNAVVLGLWLQRAKIA
jgi:asparagine synthase (glutamine-hydrolysing)